MGNVIFLRFQNQECTNIRISESGKVADEKKNKDKIFSARQLILLSSLRANCSYFLETITIFMTGKHLPAFLSSKLPDRLLQRVQEHYKIRLLQL